MHFTREGFINRRNESSRPCKWGRFANELVWIQEIAQVLYHRTCDSHGRKLLQQVETNKKKNEAYQAETNNQTKDFMADILDMNRWIFGIAIASLSPPQQEERSRS
mmetsp:Transcript_36106/g.48853  ORF Transcript_36106/g.48853 Transcript_36106/m.48853 type:complete len:106 (+) Transcript_36106:982-1299(+)